MSIDFFNDNLRLWQYVAGWAPGANIDHRSIVFAGKHNQLTRRLDPRVVVMNKGVVERLEWHPDEVIDECVVHVEYTYTRAANGLALTQDGLFCFHNTDGTEHPVTYTTHKVYSPLEQMDEGETRRNNVVKQVSIEVLGILAALVTGGDLTAAENIGLPYIAKHQALIDTYIRAGANAALQAAIAADTEAWLATDLTPMGIPGVTLHQYIIASFDSI